MKPVIKDLFSNILWYSGVTCLVRKISPSKKLTVLMYHKVVKKSFEKQMLYLKEHYNVVSEQEVVDFYHKKKELPKNSVLITFDDGYLNNYTEAYPILKKYNIPAIIFLTTGFIGKQKMPWYDEVNYLVSNSKKKSLFLDGEEFLLNSKGRKKLLVKYYYYMITADESEFKYFLSDLEKKSGVTLPKKLPVSDMFMTWSQAKEMMPLISFGSHTVNHYIVPNLSSSLANAELEKSKRDIKKHLGLVPVSFCSPNGDFSSNVNDLIKKYYKLSFTTVSGRNSNSDSSFLIKRFGVNVIDKKNIFALKLSSFSKLFSKKKFPFKVIMLTNYYYPQLGGLTTSISRLSNFLRKKSIPVTVFPFPNIFRKIEKLFNNKKIVHRVFVVIYMFMAFFLFLFFRLRSSKVVLHSHSANFCARTSLIGKLFGFKTVHTFRTDLLPEELKTVTPRPYLDRINVLTSCSSRLGLNSKHKFSLKKEIITVYESIKKKNIKRNLSLHNPVRILFVGHLFEVKDPLLFIKGVEHLSKTTKLKATLLGDGPLKEELSNYVKKHKLSFIDIKGLVNKETVEKYYLNSDVLVLTSKGEGFGNVLLEAMNHNLPVVATSVGGIPEIIDDGLTGILIKERTPKSVADAIIIALKKRKTLIVNAEKKLLSDFDIEKNNRKYIKLYQRLMMVKRRLGDDE